MAAAAEAPPSPAPAAALLLVVGGECGCPELLTYILGELERGIRSWDLDAAVCSLDEQLQAFAARHSATFSSIVRGQRSLHHRGDGLETLVLLNPSDKSLCDELRTLLLDPAPHKLLVLAGPCLEQTGELVLQSGCFSPRHFLQVLGDREIHDFLASVPPPAEPAQLTIACPELGDWTQLAAEEPALQGRLRLRLNPPGRLPVGTGLRELLQAVAESLEPPSPFELLEPPASVGFLRLARPCCYVFPGGLGDAAFFAVNGFTVLVNGGSNPKSSFWKLVRHLDRVDAVLVTHAGADSLPGLNSLLRRKLAEREEAAVAGCPGVPGGPGVVTPEERLRRLISPALGVVFLNSRAASTSRLLRGPDDARLALSLLGRLGLAPLPLSRGAAEPAPTVLFQKLGVGRLDMYVLHPPATSGAARAPPATPAASAACALLVWHPAGPTDKVVRVLFPGRTPPARLLEGLVGLQHLGFLRDPVVTPQDLAAPRRSESRESLGSRDGGATRKEPRATPTTARPAAERSGPPRKEAQRAEPVRRAAEKEPRGPREVKKDPRPSTLRTQPASREPRTAAAKKTVAPSAPKPRRAAGTPRPLGAPVENGPHSPVTGADPAMEEVAGAGEPLCTDGPSPEGTLEPALNLPLGPCTPRPRTPSPASAPQGPAESSGRLSLSPTVTTPSLPAEVGSPHSTEVDESLSVSFEQALPPAGGDAGLSLPLRGPLAQRSASPHDVDLCLVSPCEFQHRRAVPLAPASPGSSDGSSARSQERAGPRGPEETPPSSVSESLPTLSDSDPLPAQGPADSDDDTEGFAVPRRDPLPDPLKFPPPLPTPPSICMVDPEMLTRPPAKQPDSRSRKSLARPHSSLAAPKAAPVTTAKTKGPAAIERGSRPLSSRSESSAPGSRAPLSRKASVPKTTPRGPGGPASSRSSGSSGPAACPIYLDLAYLPGGGSAHLLDEEFFRRVRALCYVISGQDQRREEGLRAVLDALLAAKQQWERDLQVTLIPTFDSVAMHEWYEETHAQHSALGITVLGSNSTVSMQDEAFPACKVEF